MSQAIIIIESQIFLLFFFEDLGVPSYY